MRRILAMLSLVALSIVPMAAGSQLLQGNRLADGGKTGPTPLMANRAGYSEARVEVVYVHVEAPALPALSIHALV